MINTINRIKLTKTQHNLLEKLGSKLPTNNDDGFYYFVPVWFKVPARQITMENGEKQWGYDIDHVEMFHLNSILPADLETQIINQRNPTKDDTSKSSS